MSKVNRITTVLAWCALVAVTGCSSEDPSPTAPADPLAAGLQGQYTFGNNANDSSSNGHHGTLLGNATVNGALVCGSNDMDALSLPNTIVDGLGDFTFAGWIKFNGFHPFPSQWISGATAAEDNNASVWYSPNDNAWAVQLADISTFFPDNSAVEDQQYHHIVVTRSGTTATLYVDGVIVGPSVQVSGDALDVDPGGFIIGQDQDSLGGGFQTDNSLGGEVDELRIYNRALPAAQVKTLFDKGR